MRNVIQDILKYAGSCPECNEIMEIRSIALSVWPAQDCFQYVTQFCCEFQKESLFLNFSWNVLQHAYNSHNQENYPDILRYFFYFGGGGGDCTQFLMPTSLCTTLDHSSCSREFTVFKRLVTFLVEMHV